MNELSPCIVHGGLKPLWEAVADLVPAEPPQSCAPCFWSYRNVVRPALMRAGEEVSTAEAERRVLLLTNPSSPLPATTRTLGAGFQYIRGGEAAEPHRHTQAALRLVVEGEGGMTGVNGEWLEMRPGDLILTPSWTWHEHALPGSGDLIWLDGLDVPLMKHLGISFFEESELATRPTSRPPGFSAATYGRGLVPVEPALPPHTAVASSAPGLRYPFEEARAALRLMAEASPGRNAGHQRLRYANTATGGHILPTIAAYLDRLEAGATLRRRQTDAQVFLVVEGRGCSSLGAGTVEWESGDVFVVPNWTAYRHAAEEETFLFSFSDRALQEAFGVWRERLEA